MTISEACDKFHEIYITSVNDLPPIEGEVAYRGINWFHFKGYKDRHTAFMRWCALTDQKVAPGDEDLVCRVFGIDTNFRLHC